jgi:hypothetical protein
VYTGRARGSPGLALRVVVNDLDGPLAREREQHRPERMRLGSDRGDPDIGLRAKPIGQVHKRIKGAEGAVGAHKMHVLPRTRAAQREPVPEQRVERVLDAEPRDSDNRVDVVIGGLYRLMKIGEPVALETQEGYQDRIFQRLSDANPGSGSIRPIRSERS